MSWTLKELFRTYRDITHSTQGLLAEQLRARMPQEEPNKEDAGNTNNKEKAKSLKGKFKDVGIVNNIERHS